MIDRRWQVVPTWRRILSMVAWFTLLIAIVIIATILLMR